MTTRTRTSANLRTPRQAEATSSRNPTTGTGAPDSTRERWHGAAALFPIIAALGAAAVFLVVVVAGGNTETPSAPRDSGITGQLPDVSGSDRHLYQRVPQAPLPLPGAQGRNRGITGQDLPDVSGSDRHLYQRAPQSSQPLRGLQDFGARPSQ